MIQEQKTKHNETEYVFVEIPTCPQCHSADYQRLRTQAKQDDGSQARVMRCKACGCRYIVVYELPESGRDKYRDG